MKIQLSDHFTYKKLFKFTLPSILMMVFTSIYGVVDGFFVSNYVGKDAFVAINLIMPFLIILGTLGFMLGAGGTALIGKTLGEGDRQKANKLFSMRDSNNQPYREKFDRIVNSCEKGRTIIFSCDSDESAGEDAKGNGGYFSLAYLKVAKNAVINEGHYCSVKNIFDSAVPEMKKMFPLATQNPIILPERRIQYFPFCI